MKKTSEELDVGSEDFNKLLDFIQTEDSLPPAEKNSAMDIVDLLSLPPKGRRAMQIYSRQLSTAAEKGDKLKKAA